LVQNRIANAILASCKDTIGKQKEGFTDNPSNRVKLGPG